MGAKRTLATGDATREALMDAAEELFAMQGVEGTSVRSVNANAGVGAASVHYHFGSKDALLDAVLRRRGEAVIADVKERATALLGRDRAPTPRELVETIALPNARVVSEDPVGGWRWHRIIAQLAQGDLEHEVIGGEATKLVHQVLERVYPDVDPSERLLRWHLTGVTLLQMLGYGDAPTVRQQLSEDDYLDSYVGLLVGFLSAGLDGSMASAPTSA